MRGPRAAVVASVLVLVVFALAPAARAQVDDPYGPTTTTTEPGAEGASCSISGDAGQVGDTITATISGVPAGTRVQLTFNGEVVGEDTAESPTGDVEGASQSVAVLFGGGQSVSQAPRDASATITFQVPDLPAGSYPVVAVGPGFSASCGTGGSFEVLGASAGGTDGGSGGDQGAGGLLPRTGAEIALWVLLACAAIVVGRTLLNTSRRRRTRIA
ncbi:hypothetical protein BH24ACT3_BH24ACT3_01990 [soil metagenome]